MKGLLWVGIAFLAVSSEVAQEDEESGFFGGFGSGDEFDFPQAETRGGGQQRQGPNPVDELDAILSKGGQPLSADQKQTIQVLLEQQAEEMQQAAEQRRAAFQGGAAGPQEGSGEGSANGPAAASDRSRSASASEQARSGQGGGSGGPGQRGPGDLGGGPGQQGGRGGPFPPPGAGGFRGRNSDAARPEEEKFIANFLPVLTPEQTTIWNNFRKDQIRARGGYLALKMALEEAGTPTTSEQETQLQQIFRTYDEQKRELQRAAGPGGQPDAAKRKEADEQYLASLIKALNADQRKALLEWRRNSQQPSN